MIASSEGARTAENVLSHSWQRLQMVEALIRMVVNNLQT